MKIPFFKFLHVYNTSNAVKYMVISQEHSWTRPLEQRFSTGVPRNAKVAREVTMGFGEK